MLWLVHRVLSCRQELGVQLVAVVFQVLDVILGVLLGLDVVLQEVLHVVFRVLDWSLQVGWRLL